MEVKNKKRWNHIKKVNSDPYGSACIRYIERWADLMEKQLSKGKTIKQIAEKSSHTADTEGITGFMYGVAVKMLKDNWIHGDELNDWHNAKMGEPGIKGTVNPAIITLKERTGHKIKRIIKRELGI